jgi:acyl-coenzyme A thioesterase PaaI-like protein
MHGGCLMTFADYCLFVAGHAAIAGSHAVTASFNGDFVGKARAGDLIEGTAEVVKAGRSLVFLRGMIATGGQPIMSFSAVLKKTGPRGG